MFDFLSAPEPEESDPNANDVAVQSAEASTSTIPAEETTPVASDEVEETLAASVPPAELTSEEAKASTDTDEADRPRATPEPEKAVAAPKTTTGDEEVIDLPDFSHEPTEPGQYTLRIVFTFRPGDQSVLLSTQSHDVLAIVGELEPTGARALLAPFIAAHEGRLGEIKQALTQPTAKAPARRHQTKKALPAAPIATKTSASKKDKATKVVKPVSPAPLPQTNLFTD